MNLLLKLSISPLAGAALLLASCAAPSSYMGISFKPDASSPTLQNLAKRAMSGDRRSQLQLGEKFEYGDGVDINVDIALQFYKMAARPSKAVQVYQPGIGSTVDSAVVTARNADSQIQELAKLKISNLVSSPHCEVSC